MIIERKEESEKHRYVSMISDLVPVVISLFISCSNRVLEVNVKMALVRCSGSFDSCLGQIQVEMIKIGKRVNRHFDRYVTHEYKYLKIDNQIIRDREYRAREVEHISRI
jgi:hypothetical protein